MIKIKLWEIRTNAGLSLRQLEELTNIPKSTINNIENEKVSPTLDQLEKLAIVLNSKISDLYDSEFK
ncbi:helix-turn-helix domain-containing protein [Longibaculum muris]|uniref:helix-turn-helix domain-containing protein n=1 Tax=Longibaculum muris TaxID=1796628 RepID=UPI0022E1A08D|nr:helix-turn-helix transcriptional regulator [Longibaculum muris]